MKTVDLPTEEGIYPIILGGDQRLRDFSKGSREAWLYGPALVTVIIHADGGIDYSVEYQEEAAE